jgi:hypothetical protein
VTYSPPSAAQAAWVHGTRGRPHHEWIPVRSGSGILDADANIEHDLA